MCQIYVGHARSPIAISNPAVEFTDKCDSFLIRKKKINSSTVDKHLLHVTNADLSVASRNYRKTYWYR